MKHTLTLLTALLLAPLVARDVRAAEEKAPSPENHVYQFMTTQTYTVPKLGDKGTGMVVLWTREYEPGWEPTV